MVEIGEPLENPDTEVIPLRDPVPKTEPTPVPKEPEIVPSKPEKVPA